MKGEEIGVLHNEIRNKGRKREFNKIKESGGEGEEFINTLVNIHSIRLNKGYFRGK